MIRLCAGSLPPQASPLPEEALPANASSKASSLPEKALPANAIAKGPSAAQEALAHKIRDVLLAHLDRHVTIAELSSLFFVSPTYVKACFRAVYHVSIYAYAREQKMQAAAALLASTDERILEIAGRFGYDNGSKFASAFRSVMGASPLAYRKAHKARKPEL